MDLALILGPTVSSKGMQAGAPALRRKRVIRPRASDKPNNALNREPK